MLISYGPPSRRLDALSHFMLQWDIVMYALATPAASDQDAPADDIETERPEPKQQQQQQLPGTATPKSLGPFTRSQVGLVPEPPVHVASV